MMNDERWMVNDERPTLNLGWRLSNKGSRWRTKGWKYRRENTVCNWWQRRTLSHSLSYQLIWHLLAAPDVIRRHRQTSFINNSRANLTLHVIWNQFASFHATWHVILIQDIIQAILSILLISTPFCIISRHMTKFYVNWSDFTSTIIISWHEISSHVRSLSLHWHPISLCVEWQFFIGSSTKILANLRQSCRLFASYHTLPFQLVIL